MSKDITVEELKQKLDAKESFTFIDVREPHEYEEFNLGAKLIPLGNFMANNYDVDAEKGDEIVLHCRSGQRSAMAKMLMEQGGYTQVRNLLGGVLEWKKKFE